MSYEKVITGLKCCQVSMCDNDTFEKCQECPYNSIGVCVQDCRSELCKDALELLVEKAPRLMTSDEVRTLNWDYCYIEEEVIHDKISRYYFGDHTLKCITWPYIAHAQIIYGYESYGKRWRCWTGKPSKRQRTEAKWDE